MATECRWSDFVASWSDLSCNKNNSWTSSDKQYNPVYIICSVSALEWGKNNEDVTRKAYIKQHTDSHPGFNCFAIGLVINPQYGKSRR